LVGFGSYYKPRKKLNDRLVKETIKFKKKLDVLKLYALEKSKI